MFHLRIESIRYKPSLIAAVSLELALKFESMVQSRAEMQNVFESEWQVLKQIMRKEEFLPEDIMLCKQRMQTYWLSEIERPSQSLLNKYGIHNRVHVFLIMPRNPTQP